MKKKSFWKDTVIVGLALFSTMFGAGNLIFPPQIGLFSGQSGSSVLWACCWVASFCRLWLSGRLITSERALRT